MMGRTKTARWRAGVLIAVNVFMIIHLIQWAIVGMTISPIEPSEAMETLEVGVVNAGAIFFLIAILSTIILGRFFCGWLCHVLALQDACAWMMTRVGVRPKPFRSRLLVYFPFALGMYMFVWPSFKRSILAPTLERIDVAWPAWLRPVEPINQWSNGLVVDDFWATMPPWYIAVPFLFICGFACVYFLGAKGFCTYGCPYAAFFKPLDKISPTRIRVNDDCHQCGYCTSVCTSNVRVSEEVRDFGMVIDPGCMKTLDCVSACPNDALSLGLGKPALGAKSRSPETYKKAKLKRKGRYDMSLGEEILGAVLLLWFFFATRGVFDAVPMLLAGGLAAIATMLVIMGLKMIHQPNVRLYRFNFKSRGKIKFPGVVLALVAIGFVLASFWSGHARTLRWRGDVLYAGSEIPTAVMMRPQFSPSPEQRADAQSAVDAFRRADSPANGGVGWKLNAEHRLRLAYFLSVVGRHDEALVELEQVIAEGQPTDALVLQAGQVVIRAVDDNPPEGLNPGQLEELKRTRMLQLYRDALAQHPNLHAVRTELSRAAYSIGEAEEANAYWDVEGFENDPMFTLSQAGYVGFTGSMPRARELFEQAAEQAASLDRPAGVWIDIARTALQYGMRDLAMDLAQRALDDQSATALTWLAAGEIANASGNSELGQSRARQALTMRGVDAPLIKARAAGVLLGPETIQEGLTLLTQAAESSDDPYELVRIARGMAFAGSNLNAPELLERGTAFMEQATEQNPEQYMIRHDFATMLFSLGQRDRSLEMMIALAEDAPSNPALAQRVADIAGMMQKPEIQQRWLEEAQRRSAS